MIIHSFAELRRPGRILHAIEPERPLAEVLAQRHVHAQTLQRESARERELERLLPVDEAVRPERRQRPIPAHKFATNGQGPCADYGAPMDWGQLHALEKPHKPVFGKARGPAVVVRTGASLSVALPPVPDTEPDLLLHAHTKKRSIRKVANGGRLKLTGRHAGAYRFHPSALGE